MHNKFIDDCKSIDWQKIIDVCRSLQDLNDGQYRFLKGRFIELLLENQSNNLLEYVGLKHKDYDCHKYNYSIELKSITSQPLYKKNKELRKSNSIILNNSMGTNKKTMIGPEDVADYTIIIKCDGAVMVDKNTLMQKTISNGDGFIAVLQPMDVIELSGMLEPKNDYKISVKQELDNLLCKIINNLGK